MKRTTKRNRKIKALIGHIDAGLKTDDLSTIGFQKQFIHKCGGMIELRKALLISEKQAYLLAVRNYESWNEARRNNYKKEKPVSRLKEIWQRIVGVFK